MNKNTNKEYKTDVEVYADIPDLENLQEYDNYITKNPFLESENFKCDLSLDYVSLYIYSVDLNIYQTDKLLRLLNVSSYHIKRGRGLFNVNINGESFKSYFCKIYKERCYFGLLIKVFRPNRKVLDHIVNLLNCGYLISKVEFTADFYSNNTAELFGLIKNTLTLKWPGQNFRYDAGTVYLNNVRESRTMGGRAYVKKKDDDFSARVEIVAKRPYFKKNKINTLEQLYNITGDQIYSRFAFKKVKTATVNRKAKKVAARDFPKVVGKIKIADFWVMAVNVAVSNTLRDGVADMGRVLRAMLGKGAYMQPHSFHETFLKAVTGKKFI